MASAAIKSSVAGLLVIVFCTAGIVKITDKIAPEIHKQMRREFVELAKAHPMKVWFGRSINPKLYCSTIGYIEVISALVLYGGTRRLKIASTVIMLLVMILVMQSLYWLGKPAVMFLPGALSVFLLVLNFLFLLAEEPTKAEKKQ